MKTRTIGNATVSAIGLGGMPMSIEGRPDRERSIATIHAALDSGVTFIDTADAYHLHADDVGHNEDLIAEALRTWGGDTSSVLVATKGGHLRPGDGSWTIDSSPAHLKSAVKESARRLGVEAIGLYQLHRPDATVPYAESVGAIRDLLDEGTIVQAGISNATTDQIREAQQVLGGRLVSVQNQYSPAYRSSQTSCSSATSSASRSCPGARSAGSPRQPSSVRPSRRSPRSLRTAVSAPSRSPWPGSSPSRRSSSRSPDRAGPRPSVTRCRRPTSSSLQPSWPA